MLLILNARSGLQKRRSLALPEASFPQNGAETDAPPIGTEDSTLRSICETPEFASDAKRMNMTIVVFAWKRVASLQRLLGSLKEAEYCGHVVPLKIFLEAGPLPEVVNVVEQFHWPYGPSLVHQYASSQGIRGLWINASAYDCEDHEHVMPLEDDLEVSPFFYWWLLRAQRQYGPFDDAPLLKARGLVGVSLYTPRLNEIRYPQVKWLPERVTASPTFLHQVRPHAPNASRLARHFAVAPDALLACAHVLLLSSAPNTGVVSRCLAPGVRSSSAPSGGSSSTSTGSASRHPSSISSRRRSRVASVSTGSHLGIQRWHCRGHAVTSGRGPGSAFSSTSCTGEAT